MSAVRDAVIIAREKLAIAIRLVDEARHELQCHAVLSPQPACVTLNCLSTDTKRAHALVEQLLKRIPQLRNS